MGLYKDYEKLDFPAFEKEVLAWWKEHNTFEKSLDLREGAPAWVFYEGPPSANGMPGIHHVLSRTIKDIFCRYKTQQGYRVDRKGGWDTHGLPVELQVEKKLGITKDDIGEKISVEEYNRTCREDVLKFKDVWDDLTEKMGYWVDLDNPYITYENNYIETLWQLLKRLHDKGFLYKGHTIQPFSPAAGTGLSSHELNQPGTYKMVKDTTVVAQFKVAESDQKKALLGDAEIHFLAWTTTPWTLPSNTALAVGPKIQYAVVETRNQYTGLPVTVVLAQDLLGKYFSEEADFDTYKAGDKKLPFRILSHIKGEDLIGLNYAQLLPYVQPTDGDAFRVIGGDFVTTEDGTGIVHIAPSFGSDDYRVAKQNGIGSLTLVDKRGRFVPEVSDFANEFVKEQYLSEEEKAAEAQIQGRDKYLSVDERISIKLKEENKAFKVERYEHSYPHCWRTDKPILYYPLESWFVKTTAVKERLVELNKTINWKPASTGTGRFGNWLENLVDWNLSRSRYWGTPLPIWRTEDGSEEICIGSIEQLSNEVKKAMAAGISGNEDLKWNGDLLDIELHKPYVDRVVLVSPSGKPMQRESDLIDVWFDSGAMPYAQWHWPFEKPEPFGPANEGLEKVFPADFIAEGVDQTRGWFFTLHALGVMLFDSVAYKNVVANGLVLDKNGNKMSKRLGNAIDPFSTLEQYGADAVRWYMLSNSAPWDNLKFDLDGVAETQRKFFATLYNVYSFFGLYANIDGFKYTEADIVYAERPEIDRWILSLLNSLVKEVEQAMNDFEPMRATRAIQDFVGENLSNWYVRLCRRRFWKGEMNQDKLSAYQTLYTCLETCSVLMSSFAPFYGERLFSDLNKATGRFDVESVHHAKFPSVNEAFIDKALEERMEMAQDLSSLVLSLRKKTNIRVRQPLQKILIPSMGPQKNEQLNLVKDLLLSEVNVKELEFLTEDNLHLERLVKPNFKTLGKKVGKLMKSVAAWVPQMTDEQLKQFEQTSQLEVEIEGTAVLFEAEDLEISYQDIPGWQVASDGNYLVALDVHIDETLKQEGIARELVNRLQNLRKDSDLDVTDHIRIQILSNSALKNSFASFKDYICAETLADELVFSESATEDYHPIEIEAEELFVRINKV
ncbi:MAG: isoleucine--tRNA ligase [Bacteroidetes bacterium]|nr:MAG: isoleucine--tRNA ligase [Bacteroidota bacterium]